MSSMIQAPPRQIQIGGGQQGPQAGPRGPQQGGDGPDSTQVKKLIQQAIQNLDQAKALEGDVADQALIAKVSAELHQFLGNQQKMEDTAFGAGPGIKLVRKNPMSSGGGAGYWG